MIFNISKDIKFSNFYKKMNLLSLILIFLSIFVLLYKGLNLGVDFKGGTLIELRIENEQVSISEVRQSLIKMNLGEVSVQNFGKKEDFLIKIDKKYSNDEEFIKKINDQLSKDLGSNVNFRRVENVGP